MKTLVVRVGVGIYEDCLLYKIKFDILLFQGKQEYNSKPIIRPLERGVGVGGTL